MTWRGHDGTVKFALPKSNARTGVEIELFSREWQRQMNRAIAAHPHLIDAFVDAIAAYDQATSEHSNRVGAMGAQLGALVGLPPQDLEELHWAGTFHDLGKLAIPERLLRKTGELTPSEWIRVQIHPAVGAELVLAVSPQLAPLADAIRAHHERWDGTGYPAGLEGEGIPVLGRIIALADVYDALTHRRNYRQGMFTPAEAQQLIKDHTGSHFDPALSPVFLEMLSKATPPAA